MTFVKVNHSATQNLDTMLQQIFNGKPTSPATFRQPAVAGLPPVNILETETAFHLTFAVPGRQKTDFSIELDDQLLTISATEKTQNQPAEVKTIRQEYATKAFKRSFTVDEKIDAANIEAQYEQGMLSIQLPKKEITKAAAKAIPVL